MADLDIIRIGDPVQFADGLHVTVISILSGAYANQGIPRLDHIAHRLGLLLGLLLGLDVGDGWPLGRNLLRLCVRLGLRWLCPGSRDSGDWLSCPDSRTSCPCPPSCGCSDSCPCPASCPLFWACPGPVSPMFCPSPPSWDGCAPFSSSCCGCPATACPATAAAS